MPGHEAVEFAVVDAPERVLRPVRTEAQVEPGAFGRANRFPEFIAAMRNERPGRRRRAAQMMRDRIAKEDDLWMGRLGLDRRLVTRLPIVGAVGAGRE